MTRNDIIRRIDYKIESAAETMDKWIADLQENPICALEWGDKGYHAAAELDVLRYVAELLTSKRDDAHIPLTEIRDELVRTAHARVAEGLRSSSTSQSHNLTKRVLGDMWYQSILDGNSFASRGIITMIELGIEKESA